MAYRNVFSSLYLLDWLGSVLYHLNLGKLSASHLAI